MTDATQRYPRKPVFLHANRMTAMQDAKVTYAIKSSEKIKVYFPNHKYY